MLDKLISRLKKLWKSYSRFCEELGIDQGACRGCVPIVKFDEDIPKQDKTESSK